MSVFYSLIIGLGNPGNKYFLTRHNIGFSLIDGLAYNYLVSFNYIDRYTSELGMYSSNDSRVILVKSLYYMNHNGSSISKILEDYNIEPSKIIVIHDDVDLTFGKFKITNSGDGGHNGVKSIVKAIGTDRICRLKVGVGHPNDFSNMIEHVLGIFSDCERILLNRLLSEGLIIIKSIICLGTKITMNKFNGKGRRGFKANCLV